MPYRALTHNRVKSSINTTIESNIQATAINSQNGVSNNGPIRKTLSSARQIHIRTLSSNLLMSKNAYGEGTYVSGEGKGFPNALPQTSVGSTNAFARRAIARRAVTKLVGDSNSKNCECNPKQVKNLRGQIIN